VYRVAVQQIGVFWLAAQPPLQAMPLRGLVLRHGLALWGILNWWGRRKSHVVPELVRRTAGLNQVS